MQISRGPCPFLRPFVARLWATESAGGVCDGARKLEHVLPTGQMHLVFRLSDDPLRLFNTDDRVGAELALSIVGGARTRFYQRDARKPRSSVGVMLMPGVAERLFGASAEALAQCHTALEELWGREAALTRERLQETDDPWRRLDIMESLIARRLAHSDAVHPAVAHALARLDGLATVASVVEETGFSHRHFTALFRRSVGLSPKAYSQVQRFQRTLDMARLPGSSWADIAFATGYSDQAHFAREFQRFAGVTPGLYRRLAPSAANHLEMPFATGQISSRRPPMGAAQ